MESNFFALLLMSIAIILIGIKVYKKRNQNHNTSHNFDIINKCPNCGKEINRTDKFCGFCGYKFNDESKDNIITDNYNTVSIPIEINSAINLVYLTIAIGIISLFENGRFAVADYMQHLIVISFYVFLLQKLKQRKNWSRFFLTILLGLGSLLLISIISYIDRRPFLGIMSILQLILNVYIIYLMFSKASSKWLK